jgi:hypothetical protein
MDSKDIEKSVLESLLEAVRSKLFGEDDMNPMEKDTKDLDGTEGMPEVEMELEKAQKEPPAFAAEEEEGPDLDSIKGFLEGKRDQGRPAMKGLKVGQTEVEIAPLKKRVAPKKSY